MNINVGDTILKGIAQCALPKLEIRMLIMYVMQLTRVELITRSEEIFSIEQVQQLNDLIERRLNGEPLAYLIGEKEFFSLPFYVTPDVLIPRPETELLVDILIERTLPQGVVLDMGTGSGAIAVAAAYHRPDITVIAVDKSEAALNIARHNAHINLGFENKICFIQSDWFDNLKSHNFLFSMIVSNPPYIAVDDEHLQHNGLSFEPIDALTDHRDGLSALRVLIQEASQYLQESGYLWVEHGYDQAFVVRELFLQNGFVDVVHVKDLAGINRVTGGRLLGANHALILK